MASSREIFRRLTRELKLIYRTDRLQDVPAYAYLENHFRRFQVTGEKECRGENDVHHMADTYLCLLRSVRKYEEISAEFKGRGERSVEASARMVGLTVPPKPDDSDLTPK